MKTVKEVSSLTGISVRTLHYYDEIGLLKPAQCSGAGYRLYDEKTLETLQQILFFREFDMPLKEIKSILENPELDRKRILLSQRKMLVAKKERLERLIASMDDILKGENKMDFEVFSKDEVAEIYREMVRNMSPEYRERIIEKFGGMEEYERLFLERAAEQKAQRNFAKLVEWYGDKKRVKDMLEHPGNVKEGIAVVEAYQKRIDAVMEKLAAKKGTDVHSFEVKEIVGEYDFVTKQLYQMDDLTAFMLDLAKEYRENLRLQEAQDKVYGIGTTQYIGEALEAFYRR
ncbi:MAG: MerR family transcriptional regulator [Eubacteriales bacterium]|nr:MerR family transcriptional regulator [Eubacteriales bacterium]